MYGVDWDETLPSELLNEWKRWSEDLPVLCDMLIPRYYMPTTFKVDCIQLHDLYVALESTYATIVCM